MLFRSKPCAQTSSGSVGTAPSIGPVAARKRTVAVARAVATAVRAASSRAWSRLTGVKYQLAARKPRLKPEHQAPYLFTLEINREPLGEKQVGPRVDLGQLSHPARIEHRCADQVMTWSWIEQQPPELDHFREVEVHDMSRRMAEAPVTGIQPATQVDDASVGMVRKKLPRTLVVVPRPKAYDRDQKPRNPPSGQTTKKRAPGHRKPRCQPIGQRFSCGIPKHSIPRGAIDGVTEGCDEAGSRDGRKIEFRSRHSVHMFPRTPFRRRIFPHHPGRGP